MPHRRWLELGRVVTDHEGWEGEKERMERAIAAAVDANDECYADVVFATWGRLPDGNHVHYYETCSPGVCETFHLAALTDLVMHADLGLPSTHAACHQADSGDAA